MAKPTVALHYCGGCNPRYDRVAAVEQLRLRLPQITFIPEDRGAIATLLVCGCPVQCIRPDYAGARHLLVLTDADSLDAVCSEIRQLAAAEG